MSKMERKLVYRITACDHKNGIYSLGLHFTNQHISLSAAGHMPYICVDIYTLTPEDILQIAESIRAVALDLKPELNESLIVGAGI